MLCNIVETPLRNTGAIISCKSYKKNKIQGRKTDQYQGWRKTVTCEDFFKAKI